MDRRALVITENLDLLDDLLRVAAAAGVEVLHSSSPSSKLAWRSAPVVMLDAAKVAAAVQAGMPRRGGVLVVADLEPSSQVWEQCIRLGVDRTLLLPQAEGTLVTLLADSTDDGPGNGQLVATIGAKGGAGSSVLAAAVAVSGLAQRRQVLLADCDQWGAGQDLLFGLEADPGLRWSDMAASGGRLPADALHQALPSVQPAHSRSARTASRRANSAQVDALQRGAGLLSVLTFDRTVITGAVLPQLLEVVLDSCRRAGDLMVIDLPRYADATSDIALEHADLVAMVVPADVPACYAAKRVIDRVRAFGSEIGLVVRGPAPGGLGADDVARALGVPLICQMRPQPGLARRMELGEMPGSDRKSPLARAARLVLEHAAITLRSVA